MAQFNNLFGKDRDIVQETGASVDQKLRVASNGLELEGFDLFAESTLGTTSFVESSITTTDSFAVPPSASFDFSSSGFTSGGTDLYLSSGSVVGFSMFTDGSRIRITDTVGTVDVIFANDEVTSPVVGIHVEPISGVDYSSAPTLSNSNGILTFTELSEVTGTNTTTVTGDLTVTGEINGGTDTSPEVYIEADASTGSGTNSAVAGGHKFRVVNDSTDIGRDGYITFIIE